MSTVHDTRCQASFGIVEDGDVAREYRTDMAGCRNLLLAELAADMQEETFPPEVRALGRTLPALAGRDRELAPSTRIERPRRSRRYRIRSLLDTGRPDWTLLQTITPR